MQNTQEINWWLELAKILSPIVSAILLGLWLNARNEKIKAELQEKFYNIQLTNEERKLHLSKLEELYEIGLQTMELGMIHTSKSIEYSILPFTVENAFELTHIITKTANRIETLLAFYTYGLEKESREMFTKLLEMQVESDKFLKRDRNIVFTLENEQSLIDRHQELCAVCNDLLKKVKNQALQYKKIQSSTFLYESASESPNSNAQ